MQIEVDVVDPCFSTAINNQPITTFPAQVVRGSASVQVVFNVFTDFVSSQWSDTYGDGSNQDICAPQTYSVYEVDPNTNQPLNSA